jgi:S-adenosylmethionine hydrolase
MPIITLLTDYGFGDHYVGELKGVILTIAPEAQVVDITHDIEPFNVRQAAFVLQRVWARYPAGTVHLAIVDPGVGSDRRIILGQYAGRFVVAPDNGLVTWVHREYAPEAMFIVEDRRYFLPQLSSTFHGRDILAPVAAHLANGVKPRCFGRVTDRLEMLPIPHRAEATDRGWLGGVIYVDRFGTMVTNIRDEQLRTPRGEQRSWEVVVNGTSIGPIRTAFCDVASGTALAMIGGSGFLEIAVNQGSAAQRFAPLENVRLEVR